jgi:predicted metal-dependent phosphoesterase TrpH
LTCSTIDLHVHSTASDGTLTPRQIVREARARGITVLAITDHDTVDGLAEAEDAARGESPTLIPAVELSVGSGAREIHVLGYFIDPTAARLQDVLSWVRRHRDERNVKILQRLASLGAPVDPHRVHEIAAGGSVGRPHIAAALLEAGHVASVLDAFHRYLARGKPAYVARVRLSQEQACDLIRDAGGLPVLAHPAKLGSADAIKAIASAGMDGLEVYHCDHQKEDEDMLLALAKELRLLVTGGTDSHGPNRGRSIPIGGVAVPDWVGEELLSHAPAWWRGRR